MKPTFLILTFFMFSSSLWAKQHLESKPFLGVMTSSIRPNIKKHLKLPNDSGVMIEHVMKDSAAAQANMKKGQILVRINEKYIDSPASLMKFINSFKVGDFIEVEMLEEGRLIHSSVELKEMPVYKYKDHLGQLKKQLESQKLDYQHQGNLNKQLEKIRSNLKELQLKWNSGKHLKDMQFDVKTFTSGSGNFDFGEGFSTDIEIIPFDLKNIKSHVKVSGNLHDIEVEHGETGDLNKVIVIDESGETLMNSSNIKQLEQLPEHIKELVQGIIDDIKVNTK